MLRGDIFTLLKGRGRHYGPDDHQEPFCLNRVRAKTTKIVDIVPVYVLNGLQKSFFDSLNIFQNSPKPDYMSPKESFPR